MSKSTFFTRCKAIQRAHVKATMASEGKKRARKLARAEQARAALAATQEPQP